MDLETANRTDAEWHSWQAVIIELSRLLPNGDFNEATFNPLFRSIERWAEELVELRRKQTPEQRITARREARERYPVSSQDDG